MFGETRYVSWCVGQGEPEACRFPLRPVAAESEFPSLCTLLGITVACSAL